MPNIIQLDLNDMDPEIVDLVRQYNPDDRIRIELEARISDISEDVMDGNIEVVNSLVTLEDETESGSIKDTPPAAIVLFARKGEESASVES